LPLELGKTTLAMDHVVVCRMLSCYWALYMKSLVVHWHNGRHWMLRRLSLL